MKRSPRRAGLCLPGRRHSGNFLCGCGQFHHQLFSRHLWQAVSRAQRHRSGRRQGGRQHDHPDLRDRPSPGRLVNLPSGVNSKPIKILFPRPAAAPFLSRDINGDGVVEIPVTTLLPGIADSVTPDFTSFLVAWSVYDEKDGLVPF